MSACHVVLQGFELCLQPRGLEVRLTVRADESVALDMLSYGREDAEEAAIIMAERQQNMQP